MRKMELRESQLVSLEILKAFDEFCRRGNLRYWLIEGSALGAIRHKGIIPWDDDIDVGMPRADYDRFCSNFINSGHLELFAHGRTSGYNNQFAKLCDTRTLFIEPNSNIPEHGVFIDIFAIDYISASEAKIRKAMKQKVFYNMAFTANFNGDYYKTAHILRKIVRRLRSLRYAGRDSAQVAKEISCPIVSLEPTEFMMNVWGGWGEKELMKAAWYGEGTRVPFEDGEYLVPSDWDSYLTSLYGDYMTPPENPSYSHGCAYWLD